MKTQVNCSGGQFRLANYLCIKHSRLFPVKQCSRKLDGSGHSFCYFSRWILQTRIFLMLIPREAFNVYLSCTCTAAVNTLFCTAKNYLNIIKYFLRNPNTNNFQHIAQKVFCLKMNKMDLLNCKGLYYYYYKEIHLEA